MRTAAEFCALMLAPVAGCAVVWLLMRGLDRCLWRRDQKRCVRELRARALAELQRDALEARSEAERFGWIADTLSEIQGLPTAAGR